MRNIATQIIAAGLLAAGSTTILAFPGPPPGGGPGKGKGPHHHRPSPEEHLKRMTKDLDLSEKQISEIRKILKKYEEQKRKLHTKIRTAEKEVFEMMSALYPDKLAVRKKMELLSALKIDIKMLWLDERLEIQSVLSKEQREKWHEKMKDLHKRHGKRKRHRLRD